MLLSDRILSKSNESLNLETAKWVIANALKLATSDLAGIRRQADHPLLQDETLFDDVPNEVKALFVATPFLPRKHFNGAFAWLFGKDSIHEIVPESFEVYEKRTAQYPGYLLNEKWAQIPFTKDEYDHVYATFDVFTHGDDAQATYLRGIKSAQHISSLARCLRELKGHKHISVDILKDIRRRRTYEHIELNKDVSAEVANAYFDILFRSAKKKFNHDSKVEKAYSLISAMSEVFELNNLDRAKRDKVISTFGLENFELIEVFKIYNSKIPDEIMTKMFDMGKVLQRTLIHDGLIKDERIPVELVTELVHDREWRVYTSFFKRQDINKAERFKHLSEITAYKHIHEFKMTIINLLQFGLLTLDEIAHFEGRWALACDKNAVFEWSVETGQELPKAVQNNWIVFDRLSKAQLQTYWDIPKIIKMINEHYIERSRTNSPLGLEYDPIEGSVSRLLQNKEWTGELLMKLIKICDKKPVVVEHQKDLDLLRKTALCKLFSESIYPTLVGHGDGVGKYGRAEIPLAYVLSTHPDMLSQHELDLIAQSNIQFDYKDANVDLGEVMQMHPDLNEAAIAQQLKRRLEKIGDMSISPRKSHHI